MLQLYSYEGPVVQFDKCIQGWWSAKTWAASEKKAKSNFMYRYKKDHGYAKTAAIKLPGTIMEVKTNG